jgi:hypothetical protein
MPNLVIQNFLRSGYSFDELSDKYAIDAKRHSVYNNLVLFKYNQIESDFSERIVRECRGIILDESNDWNVVSLAFTKFFNLGEPNAATIDWNTARVQEKVDGSLITIAPIYGEWNVATTGTPDANTPINDFGITFKQLFWDTFKYQLPDPNCGMCFFFELVSPYNRVVVRYTEPKLTLLGARNLITLQELTAQEAQAYIPCPIVKEFPLNSFDACIASFDKMDPLEQEGYVVLDGSFNRVKIKHPKYVLLHHAKDGLMSNKSIVEIIRQGEMPEVLNAFPEYKPAFDEAQKRLDNLIATLEAEYDLIKDIPEQKAFALLAVKSKCSGALFSLRAKKVHSFRQYFAEMQIDNLVKLLQKAGNENHTEQRLA